MRGDVPQAPEEPEGQTEASQTALKQKSKLHIVLDKKGRKGKTATIIEGFDLPDEEVAKIAATLKQRLGTGGSSRDGEILLQGDWREKAAGILKEMGIYGN